MTSIDAAAHQTNVRRRYASFQEPFRETARLLLAQGETAGPVPASPGRNRAHPPPQRLPTHARRPLR